MLFERRCSLVLAGKFLKIRVMLGGGTCRNVVRCAGAGSRAHGDPTSSLSWFQTQGPPWSSCPVTVQEALHSLW